MRRRLPGLAAAAAAFVLPCGAGAAAPSEQVLSMYIRTATAEIPAMAASFGWASPVEWEEGGVLDTNATRVSLDRRRIGELISEVESYRQEDAVRMIIAHEVWHFVDYRRGTLPPSVADSDERRIYECRADIMAGRYIAATDRYYTGDTLESSPAHDIAQQLWRGASSNHPAPRQRARAAQFGSLTILRERAGLASQTKQAVDLRLGIGAGEPLDGWSRRACEKIAHAQKAAVNRLLVSEPEAVQRDGKTIFTITYTNSSTRHMLVSPTITATYYETSAADTRRTIELSWSFPESLRIKPGEPVTLERELTGLRNPTGHFYFQTRPDEGDALISAKFVAGPVTQGPWAVATGLSQEDTALALAIQALANEALSGFSPFRGGGSSLSVGTLSIDSTLSIPGAGRTWISLQDSGTSRVSATMYNSNSPSEAASAFARLRDRLRRIWPSAKYTETGSDSFSIRVSRYSEVSIYTISSAGNVTLFLGIEPKALGLVE